jgi:hypothetical protein
MLVSVLISTLVTLGALSWYLYWQLNGVRPVGAGPAATDTVLAALLSAQRQEVFANFIAGVETLIVGVFLPLLTAILGYIFGTTSLSPDDTSNEE